MTDRKDIRRWITLCEATQSQPTFADIAKSPKRYVYDLLDTAVGMGEDLGDYFAGDDGDTDEEYQHRAMAAQLRESAKKFLAHVTNDKMAVYRGMAVGKGWNPVKTGLGIYWTIREGAAFEGVLLEGVINVPDINLWETLVMEFTALTEDEVRLLPTATILLTSIKLNGQPVMQQFWGKTYPAMIAGQSPA